MSINAASVLKDGTIAVTGGVATPMTSLGSTLNENSVVFDGSSLLDRSSGLFTIKAPSKTSTSPNGYTQARNQMVLRFPKTLASGDVVYNTARVQLSFDVETTSAEKETIRGLVSQMISDDDFDGYWNDQVVL